MRFLRFGLIILIFIDQETKLKVTENDSANDAIIKAHVLWLIPASHTSLNQLAHPQELVVIDECAEVDAESIIAVCQARILQPGEQEPEIDDNAFSFFYRYILFYCGGQKLSLLVDLRYLWLEAPANDDVFIDIDSFLKRNSHQNSHVRTCPSCRSADKGALAVTPRKSKNGVIFNKVEYHIHDTVYIVPDQPGAVYIIGHIAEINPQYVLVRQFDRAARPESRDRVYDEVSGGIELVADPNVLLCSAY